MNLTGTCLACAACCPLCLHLHQPTFMLVPLLSWHRSKLWSTGFLVTPVLLTAPTFTPILVLLLLLLGGGGAAAAHLGC